MNRMEPYSAYGSRLSDGNRYAQAACPPAGERPAEGQPLITGMALLVAASRQPGWLHAEQPVANPPVVEVGASAGLHRPVQSICQQS